MTDPDFVRRESVLILVYAKLPKEIRKEFSEKHNFNNDVLIEFGSEFEPCEDGVDWSETLTLDQVKSYHKDQSETNGFVGDFDQFIEAYGLKSEMWLISLNLDLKGVQRILIEIAV